MINAKEKLKNVRDKYDAMKMFIQYVQYWQM